MHCLKSVFKILTSPSNLKVIHNPRVLKFNQVIQTLQYRCYSQITDDESVVHELCSGDLELEKKLRVLMLEVEVMRQDGRQAPDYLQARHWKHLLGLPNKSQRMNYLRYLFVTEKSKENEKAKKDARRKEMESKPRLDLREYPDDLEYGIGSHALFLRISDKSVNTFDNYRALQAMIRGQKLVIDCSYDEHMVFREAVNAAKQLTFVFGDNRIHKDPFNLYCCNVNRDSVFMEQLKRNIPTVEEPWFPLNMHTESYLDLFPRKDLVYLTPHCREELTEFDPNAIYIIGCMVDKMNNEPHSLAKAKRDNIKMAKLPLDRYLEWAPGSKKNLNINHMVPILLDLKMTGDWEFALRHIPRRKLMETKIMYMQKKLKDPNLRREVLNSFQNLPGVKKQRFNKQGTNYREQYNKQGTNYREQYNKQGTNYREQYNKQGTNYRDQNNGRRKSLSDILDDVKF